MRHVVGIADLENWQAAATAPSTRKDGTALVAGDDYWVDDDDYTVNLWDGSAWQPLGGGSGTSDATVIEAGDVQSDGSVLWRWGIDPDGQPYFDSSGVAAGHEAVLELADDGRYQVRSI